MNIIPSILEKDFLEIKNKLSFLQEIKKKYSLDFTKVQIDICDGIFVKNKTWLPDFVFGDKKEIEFLKSLEKDFILEYHNMCSDQKKYFLETRQIGGKSMVVHFDNLFFDRNNNTFLREDIFNIMLDALKFSLSIVFCSKLDMMLSFEKDFFDILDEFLEIDKAQEDFFKKKLNLSLQIMGIENIGQQGQDFDEKCLEIIRKVKEKYKDDLKIQIDGHVDEKTIFKLKENGADEVVVGSYLMKNLSEKEFLQKYNLLKMV